MPLLASAMWRGIIVPIPFTSAYRGDRPPGNATLHPAFFVEAEVSNPLSVRNLVLSGFRHAIADAANVEYPDRVRRVLAELGAEFLDEVAHEVEVARLAPAPDLA